MLGHWEPSLHSDDKDNEKKLAYVTNTHRISWKGNEMILLLSGFLQLNPFVQLWHKKHRKYI